MADITFPSSLEVGLSGKDKLTVGPEMGKRDGMSLHHQAGSVAESVIPLNTGIYKACHIRCSAKFQI